MYISANIMRFCKMSFCIKFQYWQITMDARHTRLKLQWRSNQNDNVNVTETLTQIIYAIALCLAKCMNGDLQHHAWLCFDCELVIFSIKFHIIEFPEAHILSRLLEFHTLIMSSKMHKLWFGRPMVWSTTLYKSNEAQSTLVLYFNV